MSVELVVLKLKKNLQKAIVTSCMVFFLCPSILAKESPELFRKEVAMALSDSPLVREAEATFLAAKSEILQSKGQRLPQVDISAQTKPDRFGPDSENWTGDPDASGSIRAVTPIIDWGKSSREIQSREQTAESARQRLVLAREDVAFRTVSAMLQVGKFTRLVQAADQYVDRSQRLVTMLAQIVEIDRGRGSELTQARARLLQALTLKEQTQAQLRDAQNALIRMLPGRAAADAPIYVSESTIPLSDVSDVATLIDRTPSVLQLEAELQAATRAAEALARSNMPALSWVISKSTAKDALGREAPWASQFQLTYGAFRGGSSQAAEQAAVSKAEAARQRLVQVRRDVQYRIKGLYEDASSQLKRSLAFRELAPETDAIREAFYEQWYTLGKRSLFDLLAAESEHYSTVSAHVTSLFDGISSAAKLKAEAGELIGWLGISAPPN